MRLQNIFFYRVLQLKFKIQFFYIYNFMSAEIFIKVQFKSQIKQILFLLLKEHL